MNDFRDLDEAARRMAETFRSFGEKFRRVVSRRNRDVHVGETTADISLYRAVVEGETKP